MNIDHNSYKPSDIRFGVFISSLLLFLTVFFYYLELFRASVFVFIMTLIILTACLFSSGFLSWLNNAWMRLGFALATIFNPIVLGTFFLLFFVPLGIFMKLIGRDELGLKKGINVSSWQKAQPRNKRDEFFDQQF